MPRPCSDKERARSATTIYRLVPWRPRFAAVPHQRLCVGIRTAPWQRCLSSRHGKPVIRPTQPSFLYALVFCWLIIPAVGLGYSGHSTRRSALASFMPAVLASGCCSIQWWLFGYSLAYGKGNGIIGDLKHFLHQGVLADPVGTIPAILFSEFQLIFCATVCVIAIGGACERGRILPLIPFIFVSAMIQCPFMIRRNA